MVTLPGKQRIYFLAICGTAMASLAALLKHQGHEVYGSDEGIYPPMSTFLEEQNIPVFSGFDVDHLTPAPDLIVVGNAISRGNVEIEEILDRHIPYISLPDAIRDFLIRGRRSIVVTGTHGKTTTTALLSWVFQYAGKDPGFLVGGIPRNFGRGFQSGSGQDFIIEGDEYDSAFFDKAAKFLRYMPDIAIINCIEFDHADIYSSLEEIKTAFRRFVNLIPRNGYLAVNQDDPNALEVAAKAFCRIETFGFDPAAQWRATNIEILSEGVTFNLWRQGQEKERILLPLFGHHNIKNALAAIAVASFCGITMDTIAEALAQFRGVKRRLEHKGQARGIDIYDDFAHHPTAVRETLAAVKSKHPHRRIWALFEPRSATTRRNIFQDEFVSAFEHADEILFAPVHRPDKAPPGQVLSLEKLAADLHQRGQPAQAFSGIDAILQHLLQNLRPGDVVITFSNGPFGGIHQALLAHLM